MTQPGYWEEGYEIMTIEKWDHDWNKSWHALTITQRRALLKSVSINQDAALCQGHELAWQTKIKLSGKEIPA